MIRSRPGLGIILGARGFYDARRAAGDTRHQALRALGSHLIGILHGCLAHHTAYRETTAWAPVPAPKNSRPLDTPSRGMSSPGRPGAGQSRSIKPAAEQATWVNRSSGD